MTRSDDVTLKDVARLAGVSVSTASRVLAGIGGVSQGRDARVREAATKLKYRPNAAARGLRRARTGTLGIIFNNLRGPGQLDLLKGIGKSCTQAGLGLLAADADGSHDLYLNLTTRFFEQRVEGLFLVSPIDLRDTLTDFGRNKVPVLTLLRKDASAGTAPVVAASEGRGIQDSIAALVGLGHQRVAHLFRYWDETRVRDVVAALSSFGLSPSLASRVFEDITTDEEVSTAVRSALIGPNRPTALIVHSAFLNPVMRAFDQAQVRVPRDLSIVAVGASSWHQTWIPGIAAVETDHQALGGLACQVMMDWIAGEEPLPAYSQLAKWVSRQTVGPPPTD